MSRVITYLPHSSSGWFLVLAAEVLVDSLC